MKKHPKPSLDAFILPLADLSDFFFVQSSVCRKLLDADVLVLIFAMTIFNLR